MPCSPHDTEFPLAPGEALFVLVIAPPRRAAFRMMRKLGLTGNSLRSMALRHGRSTHQ
jgi:hypothetical protein